MKIFFVFICFFSTSMLAVETHSFESSQQQTILLELYTSEGCSSCPPADAWLTNLKTDLRLWKDVIPLAFHVDYWDYIGWKDPFAKPANTTRQRLHQTQENARSVYTPQFIVDGEEWRGFFQGKTLSFIQKADVGILKAMIIGDELTINYAIESQALVFNIAVIGFDLETSVKRGENAGRLLKHNFVVLEHQVLPSLNNQVQLILNNMDRLRKNNNGIVIWVSKQNSLMPLQAVGGRLNNSLSQN